MTHLKLNFNAQNNPNFSVNIKYNQNLCRPEQWAASDFSVLRQKTAMICRGMWSFMLIEEPE